MVDAQLHVAALVLHLALAGAAGADAADLLGEGAPGAGQARHHIGELGQLDLQLAFAGARAPGKDVEDEAGAVDDLGAQAGLEGQLLGGREVLVDDHGAGAEVAGQGRHLVHLARTDEAGRVVALEALGQGPGDDAAGGLDQAPELGQADLVEGAVAALLEDAHQHDPLRAGTGRARRARGLGSLQRASATRRSARAAAPAGSSQAVCVWPLNQVRWRRA